MGSKAFIPPQSLPSVHKHHPTRRRPSRRRRTCCHADANSVRIAITQPQTSGNPVRNAHIAVLTDFSSNPVLAIRDRAADPLSASMIAFAAVFGGIIARFTGRRRDDDLFDTRDIDSVISSDSETAANEGEVSDKFQRIPFASRTTSGENAIWLNMSLRTIWRLFRKSTNHLTQDVLQPVLDEMEFPTPVISMKITNLTLGESPALVRKIQRLPSRSLSEIQYRFGVRLIGDKEGRIYMDVTIRIPGINKEVIVPICVSSLDIDAKVWLGFTVVPYKPWVRFAQWALVKMPTVRTKIQVGNLLPVTAIPFLSNIINRIVTKDIPKEFLFPKTQVVDLMGEKDTNVTLEQGVLAARGISSIVQSEPLDKLRSDFPHLSGLFDAIDVNSDGILSMDEVQAGLVEWGYASVADRNSISNLLDIDNDGRVELREFISVWGDLQNVFVPRRFRGVVSGVLLKAEGLRTPLIGMTDPYVVLSAETQSTRSKRNRQTSKTGKERGKAVWNEGWELFVQQPKTAMLRIEVREGCYLAYYPEYITPPALSTTHSGTAKQMDPVAKANRLDTVIGYGSIPISDLTGAASSMWVDLTTGGGRIRIDVQFSEFVDPQML